MGKHSGRKKNKILPKHRIQKITDTSLTDKIKQAGLFPNKDITLVKGTGEKMSEVLLDFADPFLDGLEEPRAIEKVLSFAVTVWNVSLLHKREQKEGINDILKIFSEQDLEMRKLGEYMVGVLLERKKLLFNDNKRFIVSYEFGLKNGQRHLNVASTMG